MKLFLVFSDTHGDVFTMRRLAKQYPQLNGIIHLGDYYKDAVIFQKTQDSDIEIIMVPGNCDNVTNQPTDIILEIEGKRILLSHGHVYNVKNGLDRLEKKAIKEKVDAVLFGHTHTPHQKIKSNIIFFNPGSISYPAGPSPTFGLLEISSKSIETRILNT